MPVLRSSKHKQHSQQRKKSSTKKMAPPSDEGATGGVEDQIEASEQDVNIQTLQDLVQALTKSVKTGQIQMVEAIKKLATNSSMAESTLEKVCHTVDARTVIQGRPDFFQGKSNENAIDFLRAVESFAELQGLREGKTISCFKVCLGPKPARWCDKFLKDNEGSNWEDIKTAFLAEFGAAKKSYLQRKNLISRKWAPGESLEQYVDDLSSRFELVQPSEEIKLDRFLEGLPGKYRAKVIDSEPANFEEAVKQAFKARSVFSASEESDVDVLRPSVETKITAQLKLLAEALNELKTNQEEQKTLHVIQKPTTQRSTVREFCRQCGDGHIMANCPHPGPVCFKCKDYTHRSRNCPRFTQQQQHWPRIAQYCTYCSRGGHQEHECRTKQRNNTICQLCRKPGHTAPVCRQQQQQMTSLIGNPPCPICRIPGHLPIGCVYNQNGQQQMGNQQDAFHQPSPQFNPSNQGN